MSFVYSKLAGKIKEYYGTQGKFAEAIGLSEKSMSAKLNGRREWKQSEIMQACDLLAIDVNDVHLYFFTEKVQNIEA